MQTLMTSSDSSETYAFTDGGDSEQLGASFTVGKMQEDCKKGTVDCSEGLKLVVVRHMTVGLTLLFTNGPPTFQDDMRGRIFQESYEDLSNWTTYVCAERNTNSGEGGRDAQYVL